MSASDPARPSPEGGSGLSRALLLATGWACVLLAVAGAVLPLLPATPFLLLANLCFARSSERMQRWLLASPLLGPYLREWREHRTVPREAKVKAVLLVLATFGTSIALTSDRLWLQALLAFLGTGLIAFLVRLPSEPRIQVPTPLAPEEPGEL